jgi:hypothetical protein
MCDRHPGSHGAYWHGCLRTRPPMETAVRVRPNRCNDTASGKQRPRANAPRAAFHLMAQRADQDPTQSRTACRRASDGQSSRRSAFTSLRRLLPQISAAGAAAYRLSERPREGSTTCCLPNSRASKEYPPGPSKQSTMASMFAHRCRTSMRSPLSAHGASPHATVAAAANGVSNPRHTRIPMATLTGSTQGGCRNSGLASAPCKSAPANAILKSSIATPGRPRGKMENSRCTRK